MRFDLQIDRNGRSLRHDALRAMVESTAAKERREVHPPAQEMPLQPIAVNTSTAAPKEAAKERGARNRSRSVTVKLPSETVPPPPPAPEARAPLGSAYGYSGRPKDAVSPVTKGHTKTASSSAVPAAAEKKSEPKRVRSRSRSRTTASPQPPAPVSARSSATVRTASPMRRTPSARSRSRTSNDAPPPLPPARAAAQPVTVLTYSTAHTPQRHAAGTQRKTHAFERNTQAPAAAPHRSRSAQPPSRAGSRTASATPSRDPAAARDVSTSPRAVAAHRHPSSLSHRSASPPPPFEPASRGPSPTKSMSTAASHLPSRTGTPVSDFVTLPDSTQDVDSARMLPRDLDGTPLAAPAAHPWDRLVAAAHGDFSGEELGLLYWDTLRKLLSFYALDTPTDVARIELRWKELQAARLPPPRAGPKTPPTGPAGHRTRTPPSSGRRSATPERRRRVGQDVQELRKDPQPGIVCTSSPAQRPWM